MSDLQSLHARLLKRLQARKEADAFRVLPQASELVDFASNDYLSFARSSSLSDRVSSIVENLPGLGLGATGSRLLTGNPDYAFLVEAKLAEFHQVEAALVFNSGYSANLGLLSALVQRNDTVFYDARIHASIRDGIRLSHGKSFVFGHNDLADLEKKIARNIGPGWVVVEALYSMDGDLAPLNEIAELCHNMGLGLLVDEAHSTGIYGPGGRGLISEYGLAEKTFARVHTFGKAMGIHGAVVLGSRLLIDTLVNFSRPFIYTTGMPLHQWACIAAAYQELQESDAIRERLHELVRYFCDRSEQEGVPFSRQSGPIQVLVIPGNERVKRLSQLLADEGLDVRPILHPTVAEGEERIRVCLHAHNTREEVDRLLGVCKRFLAKEEDA